jgi:heme exporter protein A
LPLSRLPTPDSRLPTQYHSRVTAALPPIIEAASLERRFGHVTALRSVSFTIDAGEVVLLAGPNGAGKSTLLRCLAGLSRPTAGSVRVSGSILRGDPVARSAVGFLSHQTLLYDDLTARENLRFAATLHGLDAVEERVMDALNAAGLAQRADVRAGALSHGTRQRLSIARATLHAPLALLLDEPFSGLEAAAAEQLRSRLAVEALRGRAVICVTHQPADLWPIATRIVVLDRGMLVLDIARPETVDAFLASCTETLVA